MVKRRTIGKRAGWAALILGAAILIFMMINLLTGSYYIPIGTTLRALFSLPLDGEGELVTQIIHMVRFPRVLSALLVGATLAIVGLTMQSMFSNPMAGPFVLGVSSGAGVGIAIVSLGVMGNILPWDIGVQNPFGATLSGIIGAAVVMLFIAVISFRVGRVTLLIIGLAIGYGTNACIEILSNFTDAHLLQRFIAWTYGDFGIAGYFELGIHAILLGLGGGLLWNIAPSLNVLAAGEEYARTVGVSPATLKLSLILIMTVLTGSTVTIAGPVAFIGIAAPHITRMILQSGNHRILIPLCALVGSLMALMAELLASAPGLPIRFPINAVVAIFGVPIIISMLLRRRLMMERYF